MPIERRGDALPVPHRAVTQSTAGWSAVAPALWLWWSRSLAFPEQLKRR